MSLSIGIVGLPNAGKSTLFNALVKRYQAKVDSYPFTTIDPNVGVVEVPDPKLDKIAKTLKLPKKLPTTIEFVDIAGLVKDAHQGAGLGNKFLSHIRAVQAIIHVVRGFPDPTSKAPATPELDYQILRNELIAADKDRDVPDEQHLASKPELVVLNTLESTLKQVSAVGLPGNTLIIDLKLESELTELTEPEQLDYLKSLGINQSVLPRLIQAAYKLLKSITFYTLKAGQVQAWAIADGTLAPAAASRVHSDISQGFIVAEVVAYDDLIEAGSISKARAAGKLRTEGKNYVIADGDVVEFSFNA